MLGSRSLPAPGTLRQIGVARRGSVPILPSTDGILPAEAAAPSAPAVAPVPVSARLGKMLAPSTDAYRLPDARSQWVGKVPQGQKVAIVSQWQGWFAILMGDGSQAYVPQTHVEVLPYQVKSVVPARIEPPAEPASQPVQASFNRAIVQPVASNNIFARAVIEEAFRYEGTKYVWGGNTTGGIDCSGLVKNCFAACGVSLPRRAGEQAQIGEDVPFDQLQPGDRLYFSVKKTNDHTGIYLGDGYFIHAGRSRGAVGVDHLSTPLYRDNLTSARR
jgi:cell wall-associated NlpC family hydrolase